MELGLVDGEAFGGGGLEVGIQAKRIELRGAVQRVGILPSGCDGLGSKCALSGATVLEFGLGTPIGRGLSVGLAAGRQTERFDKPRLVWSAFLWRDITRGTHSVFRMEGRFRAMRHTDGTMLPGVTLGFGVGLGS